MVLNQITQLISTTNALLLYLQFFLFKDDEAAVKVHQRPSQAIGNIPAIDVDASKYDTVSHTLRHNIWREMNENEWKKQWLTATTIQQHYKEL